MKPIKKEYVEYGLTPDPDGCDNDSDYEIDCIDDIGDADVDEGQTFEDDANNG